MKSYVKIAVIVCALVFGAALSLSHLVLTRAQDRPPTRSVEQQRAQFPTNLNLDCAGCHGPGKTLPYLGGELFHKDAHGALATSIHARLKEDGKPIASCKTCHTINGDMTTALPPDNPKSTINRSNIAETCGQCHGDKSVMQGSGITDRPFLAYRESVHAKALANGNLNAAVCTDCHTSHSVLPASIGESSIAKANIPATCGKCHGRESAEFISSVHGQALVRGVSRSPSCTDCHGIHEIQAPRAQPGSAQSTALATDSCSGCHEGVVLTREFGVSAGRVASYKDSYHGLASRLGSKTVANCASCHGVHNILPSSDPRSMINPNSLTQTCSQCHIGAGENFSAGTIHMTSDLVFAGPNGDPATFWTTIVRWIYLPLIFLVIGGMVVHNALVWRKKAAAKLKQKRPIVRLTGNQRVQHWLLLTSFIALVISGFALQYPDSWFGWMLGGSESLRRMIHRVAAVVMLVTGIYHLLYLAVSKQGRLWVKDMLPQFKDVKDLIGNIGYYLGIKKDRPKFARFGYVEKAEYWAVVWGTLIMGLTGLMLWFKIEIFGFLARWWIDVALAVHFYEAILATLAIIVWHFYSVIFDPDVYPANFAFLDGRVSEEEYKEEHELAYEDLKAKEAEELEMSEEISQEPANEKGDK
jgi:formate dehydrogenase gamma subunit